MLRRILSSIVLCTVVFTYTTAIEGASLGASGFALSSAGNQPAVCHAGRSDSQLLLSSGARKGPGLQGAGLLGVAPGTGGMPLLVAWTEAELDSPDHVLHGRLVCGNRGARGPPRCDL